MKAVIRSQIRVLSVDDHPLVREGIATVIKSQPDMQLVRMVPMPGSNTVLRRA